MKLSQYLEDEEIKNYIIHFIDSDNGYGKIKNIQVSTYKISKEYDDIDIRSIIIYPEKKRIYVYI